MLDSRDFEGLITSRKTSGVQINKQDDFNPWEAGAMRKGEEDNIVCVGGGYFRLSGYTKFPQACDPWVQVLRSVIVKIETACCLEVANFFWKAVNFFFWEKWTVEQTLEMTQGENEKKAGKLPSCPNQSHCLLWNYFYRFFHWMSRLESRSLADHPDRAWYMWYVSNCRGPWGDFRCSQTNNF